MFFLIGGFVADPLIKPMAKATLEGHTIGEVVEDFLNEYIEQP